MIGANTTPKINTQSEQMTQKSNITDCHHNTSINVIANKFEKQRISIGRLRKQGRALLSEITFRLDMGMQIPSQNGREIK
jgi:hypothetical protein